MQFTRLFSIFSVAQSAENGSDTLVQPQELSAEQLNQVAGGAPNGTWATAGAPNGTWATAGAPNGSWAKAAVSAPNGTW